MNRKNLFLLLGALTLGWAANAQSTGSNPASDTTHTMHHRFHGTPRNHDGAFHHTPNDSTFHHYHHTPNDFARAHHRFHHREFIHYTPDQRQQVTAINKEYHQKSADLFKQDNLTLRQYKSGLLALDKERKAKLQSLLTQEQKDQLAAHRKRMDENRQVMAAAHLERLRLELNLTDAQVTQIKAGQHTLHTQAQAIHDNDNLLPQEKREQIRALMLTRNDNLKTILTPDQYTKLISISARANSYRSFE